MYGIDIRLTLESEKILTLDMFKLTIAAYEMDQLLINGYNPDDFNIVEMVSQLDARQKFVLTYRLYNKIFHSYITKLDASGLEYLAARKIHAMLQQNDSDIDYGELINYLDSENAKNISGLIALLDSKTGEEELQTKWNDCVFNSFSATAHYMDQTMELISDQIILHNEDATQ
jgi:hypothetical protein